MCVCVRAYLCVRVSWGWACDDAEMDVCVGVLRVALESVVEESVAA